VIREDFHAGLCIRVVSGLEPQLVVPGLLEEGLHHRCIKPAKIVSRSSTLVTTTLRPTNQVTKVDIVVCYYSFNLVELGQMGGVSSLIPTKIRPSDDNINLNMARPYSPEDPIDTEQLARLKTSLLVSDPVEHIGRDGSGVSSEQELPALFVRERSSVSDRTVSTSLVYFPDSLVVVCWGLAGTNGVCLIIYRIA
jgi:hypothetical protein